MDPGENSEQELGEFYKEFGRRVRLARGGQSQGALALRVGISRGSISNIEAGRQHVPLHLLAILAKALGVPQTDLLPDDAPAGTTGVDLDGLFSDERAFVVSVMKQSGAVDGKPRS